ncbi:hypothetical protein HYFRA_00012396 [Hymenoscyphus fraxineus]|uniref:Uncharacterized protein n=1 Tax=Hymenoscyphus fraxineus TaxID=746836 RepID=A0A9N9Q023_9HELO|nr:hypothetical protein HYFRA_00012396 [Hymenoscyphus fraxineus]
MEAQNSHVNPEDFWMQLFPKGRYNAIRPLCMSGKAPARGPRDSVKYEKTLCINEIEMLDLIAGRRV